ncbi:MAG TPA: hypothetical protein VGF02_03095 [Pseudolabrys sp.]|jgi:hypothetical protein
MVKFVLPRGSSNTKTSKVTAAVTMRNGLAAPAGARRTPASKILIEFDNVEFDENSPRIRVDFVQKHRFNANDSFKPVWYGLV